MYVIGILVLVVLAGAALNHAPFLAVPPALGVYWLINRAPKGAIDNFFAYCIPLFIVGIIIALFE
jgi:hypothetical protein